MGIFDGLANVVAKAVTAPLTLPLELAKVPDRAVAVLDEAMDEAGL